MSKLWIGRHCASDTLAPDGDHALVSADRLTRHAVCLGMTGSGKTGLCITLLEELALARVPVLAIDPKGDIANLALAFPDLQPADFTPWVDPGEASRQGISVETLGERTAAMWRKGHDSWGIDDARRRALADRTDVMILTPGSDAGVPIDVLASLAAPPEGLGDDAEGLRDYVTGATGALLGLVGIEADPLRDPEAILVARLLGDAWAEGRELPLDALLPALVDPPFDRVGVFPLDTFFPRKDRLDLAMRLNGILASPSFAAWRQGIPLDIDALLTPKADRTPVRVLYLAHLDDSQRMFFVTMLLHAVVAWSRRQPGTGTLRALLYFDEVFGYLPPHPRNPPSKQPILTLMKQARAVGVGTMLCTQNPVDVDYKALSNAGSWWVGRLQTEQDRARVVDGLVQAAGGLDASAVHDLLARLPARTFLWRDVKASTPAVVHARWAMSFLRGPLTRREVAQLGPAHVQAPEASAPQGLTPPSAPTPTPAQDDTLAAPPPAPDDVEVRWLSEDVALSASLRSVLGDARRAARPDGLPVYAPALMARLDLTFDEGRDFDGQRVEHRLFFPLDDARREPLNIELPAEALTARGPQGARYLPLPDHLDEASEFKALRKAILEDAWRGETMPMYRHRALKLTSHAGEQREAFDARIQQGLRDAADAEIAKLKGKVDTQIDRLEAKARKLELDQAKYESEASSLKTEELVGAGETLLSMFFGRRRSATAVVSRRRRTMKAQDRAARAEDDLESIQEDLADLEDETAEQIEAIEARFAAQADDVETVMVGLEKSDIHVTDFTLVWIPVTAAL